MDPVSVHSTLTDYAKYFLPSKWLPLPCTEVAPRCAHGKGQQTGGAGWLDLAGPEFFREQLCKQSPDALRILCRPIMVAASGL